MSESPPNEVQPRTIKTVDDSSANGEATTTLTLGSDSYVLPFPTGLQIDSEYNWESSDLGALGQEVFKNGGMNRDLLSMETAQRAYEGAAAFVKQGALDLIVDNLGKATFAAEGKVLNPKKEVLFSGTTHRAFQLEWHFAPLNQKESEASYEFIKAVHVAAAPEITSDTTFLTYPETVTLVVQDGGAPILNRQECAITSLSCNMTPDGLWATFTNGKPVHIALTVGFLELQLPTKDNARAIFGG